MGFIETLKYLREEKGLTQKELAKSCNLSPQCISALEIGRNLPNSITLTTIARYFDVTVDYLLGLENDYGAKVESTTVAPTDGKLTAKERELLSDFRKLSPYLQSIALNTVRGLTGAGADDLHKKA